ncbi:MAG: rhodanese-like domain-containing protein [Bacteroidota bacterium]
MFQNLFSKKDRALKNLSQGEWKSLLDEKDGAIILDVRTPEEWAEGIIPGAKKLNIMDRAAFSTGISKLDPEQPVFLYCRSGGRSGQAGNLMEAQGFKELYNLKGGMMMWRGEVSK